MDVRPLHLPKTRGVGLELLGPGAEVQGREAVDVVGIDHLPRGKQGGVVRDNTVQDVIMVLIDLDVPGGLFSYKFDRLYIGPSHICFVQPIMQLASGRQIRNVILGMHQITQQLLPARIITSM